ncbi:MAG TPA: MerR family transcriptional regulator [Phenylobacterium sp.]|uniref:MerR family transcriptional regulator n=1 Tax=Phenylobacterium sp. TaxID=1871053 RepID=UPI002D469852|nr:MerR family transcriptional regulator [Phenylobacterium sp.]HZZ68535.1 MerR family transcriptional regulator [Phenylobacterium sp.]
MSGHTVKQVARMSGVSVRTLHHYDEIGLLKPACVGANGYRYYAREELLRLQQVLFHRELGFSLEEIARVLDAPGFDRTAALRAHRAKLEAESRRYRRLVRTIDETLAALEEGAAKMEDKAMYRGFDPEKQASYEKELVETHGPEMQGHIDHAKRGMAGWRQADYDAMQAEAEAIEAGMAKALTDGLPVDASAVTALMRRQHAWVGKSWNRPAPAAAFKGLGEMYLADPRFRDRYDGRQAGLAEYMAAAMAAFADRELG